MKVDAQAAERRGNSLFRYSPALILLAIAIADSQRWADPDLWGHLRFGQAALAQGHLIRHDPYSYSVPGHLWLNHEWLTEVVMAAAYNALGVVGLKLWKLTCSAAIIGFLALALQETEAPVSMQFGALLLTSLALMLQVQFRPQIFTYALSSAMLALLARYQYRGRAPLWIAIPMLALWANLHGGFIVGLGALGIFSAVSFVQDLARGRGVRRGLMLVGLTGASTVATLATPYGIGAWQAVLHALHNPHTRQLVKDWQPLHRSFLAIWQILPADTYYMVIAVAMFAALLITFIETPGDDLPMMAIAGAMFAAMLVAIRNLPLSVIATVPPLGRHVALMLRARRERRAMPEPAAPKPWARANQLIAAAAAIALLAGTGLFSRKLPGDQSFPVGAIAFMKEHRLDGNVMADFGWGEYVIWQLPQSKVFIDGRYDTVYPPAVIQEYLNFVFAEGDGRGFLGRHSHDFVLLDPNLGTELDFMNQQRDWKEVYRDETCRLYARADSPAAKIPAVVVPPGDTPRTFFP